MAIKADDKIDAQKLVWITRPEEKALGLSLPLDKLNYKSVISPLLKTKFLSPALPHNFDKPEQIGGFIATSSNGLLAFEKLSPQKLETYKSRPIFCVGPRTANMARQQGWKMVVEGHGTGAGLANLINDKAIAGGYYYHLSGKEIAFDLKPALEGIRLTRMILYEMIEAQQLSDEIINLLEEEELSAVTLLSPNTAKIYLKLVTKQGLQAKIQNIKHICLSKAIARCLYPLNLDEIKVMWAEKPNLPSFLSLFQKG